MLFYLKTVCSIFSLGNTPILTYPFHSAPSEFHYWSKGNINSTRISTIPSRSHTHTTPVRLLYSNSGDNFPKDQQFRTHFLSTIQVPRGSSKPYILCALYPSFSSQLLVYTRFFSSSLFVSPSRSRSYNDFPLIFCSNFAPKLTLIDPIFFKILPHA